MPSVICIPLGPTSKWNDSVFILLFGSIQETSLCSWCTYWKWSYLWFMLLPSFCFYVTFSANNSRRAALVTSPSLFITRWLILWKDKETDFFPSYHSILFNFVLFSHGTEKKVVSQPKQNKCVCVILWFAISKGGVTSSTGGFSHLNIHSCPCYSRLLKSKFSILSLYR